MVRARGRSVWVPFGSVAELAADRVLLFGAQFGHSPVFLMVLVTVGLVLVPTQRLPPRQPVDEGQ